MFKQSPKLLRSIQVQVLAAIILGALLLGGISFHLVTQTIDGYIEKSVLHDMQRDSRNVSQIFDSAVGALMKSGKVNNPVAVRIAKAKSLAKFEDYLRTYRLSGCITWQDSDRLFQWGDIPQPLQQQCLRTDVDNNSLQTIELNSDRHFIFFLQYAPWGQRIALFQDQSVYSELTKEMYQIRNLISWMLLAGLVAMVLLLYAVLNRPIQNMIAALQENRPPNYRGLLEFEYLSDAFGSMMQELERVGRVKDDFLASMSHELRTPLTSIIGNSELLLEECGDSQCPRGNAKHILRTIHRSGSNQLALVNDILDMSKIESGKFTIDLAPYDLNRLLSELQSMFSVRAADAGVSFVLDQKNSEPYLLLGDGQRVGQVLINLVSNAIKFTEQGEVRLTSWVEQGTLTFEVKDSGIGMSREVVEHLFERFHQADSSTSRRFGGSGLGLYISENLTNMMEGEIDVSSKEGVGSIFTVRLPYSVTDTPSSSSDKTEQQTTILDEKLTGHVLIAEDTPELQLLERRILESIGLSVTVANDGQEALDLINQHHFDAVLMDMQMPNVDGIEATRMLREQEHTLPVIALTANVMQKHRDAFHEAGCDGFLGKPIDKQALRKLLKQHLSQKPQPLPKEVDEELMAVFRESAANYNNALKKSFLNKEWDELRKTAHTVKGSAASFGFNEISKCAEAVQSAVDEEQLDSVPELTMDLLTELGKVL